MTTLAGYVAHDISFEGPMARATGADAVRKTQAAEPARVSDSEAALEP
jgi:hypothetical protein